METVQFQSFVFSYTVYGGIIIGVFYDVYRVIRGKKRNDSLFASFWDVLFLFSVFLVVMWAVFSSSYGDIRAYVFIGFIVGFYLYEKLLGRIAAGIFHFMLRNTISFFKRTNNILVLPIKLACSFLYHCYYSLVRFFGRKKIRLRKVGRMPKQIVDESRKYYRLIAKRKIHKRN